MGDIHEFWHRDHFCVLVRDGSRIGYVDRPRQQWYGRRRSNLKATWCGP